MSHLSNEFPAVPMSARPVRSVADKNTEFPVNSHIKSAPECSGATATPDSSHSKPTTSYPRGESDSRASPPKFKHQPISFSDPKMSEGATGGKKDIKPRVDTFLSIRITSPSLISKLTAIQSEFNQSHASASRTIIRPSLFHLTLLTMHTGEDEGCIKNATELTQTVLDEFCRRTGTPSLTFRDLGLFSNKVLFASLLKDKNYEIISQLALSLSNIFAERYPQSFDEVSEFTPHLTLAKTSKTLSGPYKQRLYKFQRPDLVDELVSKYSGCELGAENVCSVQLLSMSKPKDEDGFYHCYHTFNL